MFTVVFLGKQCLVDFQNNPVKQCTIDTFGHSITRRQSLPAKDVTHITITFSGGHYLKNTVCHQNYENIPTFFLIHIQPSPEYTNTHVHTFFPYSPCLCWKERKKTVEENRKNERQKEIKKGKVN